ncbi:MAG TPA: iron-containing alcohol dehydrogenase, partial [Haliangium sp.]|nr:iron-containing alcohol dehydrogenase [Haliangium sp.]
CTDTLPGEVVAASGFDVLSHALESYTARPYTRRPAPARPGARPMSQGANPWSDMGCAESLRLLGRYLLRAITDAGDREAREQVMWAATLAGIAFGNAGVHAPHGMSYAVAGLVRDFRPSGYPQDEPMVPHGMAVIVNAPAVFRYTAQASPERHLQAAAWLGADTRGASPAEAGQPGDAGEAGQAEAGEILASRLVELMRAARMPNGIGGVGYGPGDLDQLAEGAHLQQRLLQNAPCALDRSRLVELFRDAIRYW